MHAVFLRHEMGAQLLQAVKASDHDRIRELVAAGIDINVRCDQGASVLFLACLNADVGSVRLLLDLGADPNLAAEEPAADIYAPKPLDLVMQAQFLMDWGKYTPVFELLLERGAFDSDGQAPTSTEIEARRQRALEWQHRRVSTPVGSAIADLFGRPGPQ